MRGDRFTRQLRLLQMLESRPEGLELEEAARELGRGRRTVYRDFEVLEQSGVPLLAEHDGRHARWRIMEGYRHRLQISLTWSEVLALSTGSQLMSGLAGTLFHESAVSALEKIRATLPRALAERVRASEGMVSTRGGGHDYESRGRILEVFMEAIERRVTVTARYRSRSTKTLRGGSQRRIDPYHLRISEQAVYVIAFCHRARSPRTFLLDRFDHVEATSERFSISPEFRPDAFLGGSFGMWSGAPQEVRFIASPEIAQLFLEKKLHPSQTAQRCADGTVEVGMHVAIGPPLVAYLAGLGASVRELEPEELRRQVEDVHREALGATRKARPRKSRVSSNL